MRKTSAQLLRNGRPGSPRDQIDLSSRSNRRTAEIPEFPPGVRTRTTGNRVTFRKLACVLVFSFVTSQVRLTWGRAVGPGPAVVSRGWRIRRDLDRPPAAVAETGRDVVTFGNRPFRNDTRRGSEVLNER
jgi:hypothetical protein